MSRSFNFIFRARRLGYAYINETFTRYKKTSITMSQPTERSRLAIIRFYSTYKHITSYIYKCGHIQAGINEKVYFISFVDENFGKQTLVQMDNVLKAPKSIYETYI